MKFIDIVDINYLFHRELFIIYHVECYLLFTA